MDESGKPSSRNIPQPIQRAIRQRCGFGCVVCGSPLYEYDHLLGWAQVQRHVAEEITLLCLLHHRERGSGLLPIATVLNANAAPHNIRTGVSSPHPLHYFGNRCEVVMGATRFIAEERGNGAVVIPLLIDGVAMIAFSLEDGHLLLHLNLFDEFNQCVLAIQANHLEYSVTPWDIQLVKNRLTVREAARRILIEIEFEPPDKIHLRRGRFLLNGVEVLLRPDSILVNNTRTALISGVFENVQAPAIVIGARPPGVGAIINLAEVSRYPGDRAETKRWWNEVLADDASGS